jgi:hypothetical protein
MDGDIWTGRRHCNRAARSLHGPRHAARAALRYNRPNPIGRSITAMSKPASFRTMPVAALVALIGSAALPVSASAEPPADGPGEAARIEIFKPTGSIQCEPDSGTPLADMQQALTNAGIDVHAAQTTSDGRMYAQVCGAPGGEIHVFSIDAADAAAAAELGFLPFEVLTPSDPSAPPSQRRPAP